MTFGVFECMYWVGSMQTPLSPAAYCEPRRPTRSCKPAKSATFFEHRLGASTVRLQAVGAFAFPLALLSLDIAWIALWAAQLAAHFNEKWISPSPLPFQCMLDAPVLPLFFLKTCLEVLIAEFNSDLTSNLINQMSQKKTKTTAPPPKKKDCKEAAVRFKTSANSPNNKILVNLRSEIVFKTRATKLCRRWDEIQANISSNIYQKQISGVLHFTTKDVSHLKEELALWLIPAALSQWAAAT